jgi:hypothetical protein
MGVAIEIKIFDFSDERIDIVKVETCSTDAAC